MWRTGLAAPRHVGSSQTRARTHVARIGRRLLNHCTTREVHPVYIKNTINLFNIIFYIYRIYIYIEYMTEYSKTYNVLIYMAIVHRLSLLTRTQVPIRAGIFVLSTAAHPAST